MLTEKFNPLSSNVPANLKDLSDNGFAPTLASAVIDKYGNAAQPLYIIIDSDENNLSGPIGYCSEDEFYQFLK